MQPAQYAAHHRLLLYATHNRQTTIAKKHYQTRSTTSRRHTLTHTPDQKLRTKHVHTHQCYNFHFGPHVYCLHGVAHLREIPHVSTTFGKKWIHGVSSIYTSGIHYVSDTPRVSSGYPMYPVYPYVSLCIPMYPYVSLCILCVC